MNKTLRQELNSRNSRIIEAIKTKAKVLCPDSIVLIAIAGSFCSGDYYEKSDLDLLIVTNDFEGQKISKCFILDDIAHDIYCHTWNQLEQMAQYENPYIIKLINVDIIYYADESVIERYERLKCKVQAILAQPFGVKDLTKVKKHFDCALKSLGEVVIEDDLANCKYLSASMINHLEYAVYMLNKTYIKVGIRRIPEEICGLRILPDNFEKLYWGVINANSITDIKSTSARLVKATKSLISKTEDTLAVRQPITSNDIRGTYEEVCSNWKNKIAYAACTNNKYLSLMTTASCQSFYDEMHNMYDIKRFDLFSNFDIDNLKKTEIHFNKVLEEYSGLYSDNFIDICYYSSIEEFEKDYIK